MKRLAVITLWLVGIITLSFWYLTRPGGLESENLADHLPDLVNGEAMFHAGACASCHALPDAGDDDRAKLGGGHEIKTEFGVFRVPNISPDPETGIGNWSETDFVLAMLHGVSPGGEHYYPAFPYPSYTRMKVKDVRDLKAYLDTLPVVSHEVDPHDLGFPWNIRRGVGLWKLRYLDASPVVSIDEADDVLARGRYLAEGVAHCGECHTRRDRAGGLMTTHWLSGAPNPDGKGRVPDITPHVDGLAEWSNRDIEYYLESGLTPDFDTVGGSMVEVQENLARLPVSDREAISTYLKAIPALPDLRQPGD